MEKDKGTNKGNTRAVNKRCVKYVYARDGAVFKVLAEPEKTKYSYRVQIVPWKGEFYDAKEKKVYNAEDLRDCLVYLNIKREEDLRACKPGNVVVKRGDGLEVIRTQGATDATTKGAGRDAGNATTSVENSDKGARENLEKKGSVPPEDFVASAKNSTEAVEKITPATKSSGTTEPPVSRISLAPDSKNCVEVRDASARNKVDVCYEVKDYSREINGDKVVETPILQVAFKYNNNEFKCAGEECEEVAKRVARLTDSHPPKVALLNAVEDIKRSLAKETPVCEYVKAHYPDLYNELDAPLSQIVAKYATGVKGFAKIKRLVTLAVESAKFKRVELGISRINLLLVGEGGAGKSSIVKSVLALFPRDRIIYFGRVTENALGYTRVDYDGKVLFIEQIDRQRLNYLRELMSEGIASTLTTLKDEKGRLYGEHIEVKGQPVVITTSVADDIDVDREQLMSRFFPVYVNPREEDPYERGLAIAKKKYVDEEWRFAVRALVACAFSRVPDDVELTDEVADAIVKFIDKLRKVTGDEGVLNRATEKLRNLVKAYAGDRYKRVADMSDFNGLMAEFGEEVLLGALELTEREIEYLRYIRDLVKRVTDKDGKVVEEYPTTTDIVNALRKSPQYVRAVLKTLEERGLAISERRGSAIIWKVTDLGRDILAYIEGGAKGDNDGADVKDPPRLFH